METPGFIFSTTGQGAPTYEELQKQRTILAHLLAQRRGPPKNIGEGLTALGEGPRRLPTPIRRQITRRRPQPRRLPPPPQRRLRLIRARWALPPLEGLTRMLSATCPLAPMTLT